MKKIKELYRKWRRGEEIEFEINIPLVIFLGIIIAAAITIYKLINL